MLNTELIVKGSSSNRELLKNLSMGKYVIDCQRKRNPAEAFCIDGVTKQILTNGQLVSEALKLAHILRELGVKKDDVVAIVIENNVKYAVILIAILYIGAVANPLNPGYSTGELKHAFNMSKPKVLFCSKLSIKNVKEALSELHFIGHFILVEAMLEDEQGVDNLDALLELTKIDTDEVEPAEIESTEQTALILLSSGTTGLPKGVMLTHDNFRYPLGYCGDPNYGALETGYVAVGVLPFFHILGLSAVLLAAAYCGKLVILPTFQPDVFLKCVQEYKATMTTAVPPIISFLAKHPIVKMFDVSSIKMILCSGGYLGKEIHEEYKKVHPYTRIALAYGITEVTGACTMVSPSDTNKFESVGRLIPYIEAMIWSAELGKNLAALETGELCFRGPTVMKGYVGRESNDIDEYGFYHTGDIGYYDEDGCFYIVGRIKELIKYKGFQVAPAELEDLLLKHPAVKECGVVGIPDERAGQLPLAFIVCQSGASVTSEELINFVAERISVQKRLHGGVRFIDSIPRNAAGKILRQKLLELYVP